MRKIFASDLDQTLIYSKRFLQNLNSEEINRVELVEDKNEDIRSFMSKNAIERIKKYGENNIFIPTTTRTVEQYNRVFVFSRDIRPKYAVVSNGGNIIVNGEVDIEWNNEIKKKVEKHCLSGVDVLKKYSEFSSLDWSSEYRLADDLFYYFIVKRDIMPYDKIDKFSRWLDESGWNLSIQKKKMYFVPKVIDKFVAVKHIAETENINDIFAAGDSILDLGILNNADFAIIPNHSEELQYIREVNNKKIVFTDKSGIFAADDIMSLINI